MATHILFKTCSNATTELLMLIEGPILPIRISIALKPFSKNMTSIFSIRILNKYLKQGNNNPAF